MMHSQEEKAFGKMGWHSEQVEDKSTSRTTAQLMSNAAVQPAESLTVYCMDRTVVVGKTKSGGVCLIVNGNWCNNVIISLLFSQPGTSDQQMSHILPPPEVHIGYHYCCLHSTIGTQK